MSELKPDAWMVIECGCRAPDDCEDYETLFTNEEWERVKGDYQRHVEHDRAFPLYADTSAIEAAVLRRVAVDYGNYISDGGTLEAPYWLFQEAGLIEKGPSDAG